LSPPFGIFSEGNLLTDIDISKVSGYATDDRYLATRYVQGDRQVFDFELPLNVIPEVFPVPDPDRPTLGNRRVKPDHAKKFAQYVREQEHWVAPALLMRAPDIFSFETNLTLGGVSFGIMGVPRSNRRDIRIIDGQHRILGLYMAVEDIARELDDARNRMAEARQDDNLDLVNHFAAIVERLERQRRRLATEHLAVQVHVETEQKSFEQMFVDVADNALGITQAIKVRFDSRKIMNRSLEAAMRHALLRDHVDEEQDRITGPNPNLLGAKHVVDIIRTVNIGITGRVGRRLESELQEGAVVQRSNEFFDVLLEAFDDLAGVADGTLAAEDLRKRSLLGSSTMLRVLAGVYHDLSAENYPDEEISDFFRSLAPHMTAPIAKGSPWLAIRTKVFAVGANAPTARAQDLRSLAEEVASWIDGRPSWLAPEEPKEA
jgi:DNA-sulfur modification-associated